MAGFAHVAPREAVAHVAALAAAQRHPPPPRTPGMPLPPCHRLAPAALLAALLAALVAALVAALLALPAGAQVRPDSTAGDSTARTVAPVVVRGVRAPAVVGGAAAIVADVDSLRLGAAPVLDQLLRALPFVSTRRNSRGEMELSVRGSDSRQTAVLVDGVPLTLGWDHRSDPSLVPLTGARSVTLVRGLSSLLHGPNVLGGVVDVALDGGAGGGVTAVQAAIATDVDQTGGRGLSLTGGAPLAGGRVSVRGGVGHRSRNGVTLGGDVADLGSHPSLRTNSDVRQTDLFGSVRLRAANGAFAGLTVSAYEAERGVPPELHLEEPRLWRYPRQRRAVAIASAGSGARATAWGHGSVRASVGLNAGTSRVEAFGTPAYDEVVDTEDGDERTATARVVGEHAFPAATLRLAATVAEVRYDETLGDAAPSRYRQRLWSVASELGVPVGPDVELVGGVATDGADTPESGGRESLGRLTRLGGRVGLAARVPGDVRLHVSASQRARFPALRELYSGALDRFAPNPQLRPETLLGVEAGATRAWGAFELQGTLFRHGLRDAVVRTTLPDRRFRRENRSEIRSAGVELFAGWRGARGHALLADVTAQRVRLRDRAAGGPLRFAEHQPELRAGLDAAAPLPFDVRAMAGVRHSGRQYCTNPDLGAQQALAAQTAGDVRVERDWSVGRAASLFRTLRVTLALENVTDAAAYDQCGLPQPGRTGRVVMWVR